MEIRPLSDNYSVSPQISTDDVPAIAAAGYTTVICNRPDGETLPENRAAAIRAAVEAEGLRFIDNAFTGQTFGEEHITAQRNAIDSADGPVLAYCASGNRSSIAWALANAGRLPTGEMIEAASKYGYQVASF